MWCENSKLIFSCSLVLGLVLMNGGVRVMAQNGDSVTDRLVCQAFTGITILRCALFSEVDSLNCVADCVCNHGAYNGTCVLTTTSETSTLSPKAEERQRQQQSDGDSKCVCNYATNLAENVRAGRHKEVCSAPATKRASRGALAILCAGTRNPNCSADCVCGHLANNGTCTSDGFCTCT